MSAARGQITGLRGSGSGVATVSGRRIPFTYAFVYDWPGWLRLDVRPDLGAVGTGFTALALVEANCVRAYIPWEEMEIRGCLDDLAAGLASEDLAGAVLGVPDPSLFRQLEDAVITYGDGVLVVKGNLGERTATIKLVGDPPEVERISLEKIGSSGEIDVSYEERSRRGGTVLPWRVEIILAGERGPAKIQFEHATLRPTEPVRRSEYAFEVPPNVRAISWEVVFRGRL